MLTSCHPPYVSLIIIGYPLSLSDGMFGSKKGVDFRSRMCYIWYARYAKCTQISLQRGVRAG